jgi:hypothetical protein
MELSNTVNDTDMLHVNRFCGESGLETARRMRYLSLNTGKVVVCAVAEDVIITAVPGETPVIR